MLANFGDGHVCECVHCGVELTFDTLTVDRVVTGIDGGSYADDNIVPACRPCNCSRQDAPMIDFHLRIGRVSINAQVQ